MVYRFASAEAPTHGRPQHEEHSRRTLTDHRRAVVSDSTNEETEND